jgi:hypothetical protein
MGDLRRIGVLAAAALTIAVSAVGCGVSTSSPTKLGDGIAAGQRYLARTPPGPNEAVSPADLVSAYLSAAAESGSDQPLQRLQGFLTTPARAALTSSIDTKNPPSPTVIRVLGAPSEGPITQDGTQVDVRYEVVGLLNDRGRVDALADPNAGTNTGTMHFSVKTAEENSKHLRIDAITDAPPNASIMISDAALYEFYQVQPVYFWDVTNTRLIPDIRYVPNGLDPAVRANRIVQWLLNEPSPWLGDSAQRLPSGAALKSTVVIRDGRLEVNLNAQAGASAPAIQRLYRQLQWSLQSDAGATLIDLSIEDKLQTNLGGLDDYRAYDLSWSLAARGQKYDIVDGKVVAASTLNPPPVLSAKENAGVVYAAMNRNATMALVRTQTNNRGYLQLVKDSAPTIRVNVPYPNGMGRPVWVTNDLLVLPSGNHLYSVTSSGDWKDLTPPNRGPITKVSVSPDGRRIAFVAGQQAVVASLILGADNSADLGSSMRDILKGVVAANAVAWASEGWLYVAGTSGSVPTLWRATADGVIGEDNSSKLAGVTPTDMVAYPTAPFASVSAPEVLLYANQAIYQMQGTANQDAKLKAPFFGL